MGVYIKSLEIALKKKKENQQSLENTKKGQLDKLAKKPHFFHSGSIDKQSVEITNVFCVPHKEYEERVEVNLNYAQEMLELNK